MSESTVADNGPEVLITGELAKLPPAVAPLLDPAVPLPPGTVFFEKRFTVDDLIKRVVMATGLLLAALIIVPLGVLMVISDFRGPQTVSSRVDWLPLGFGLVCGLASWMMFASVGTCSKLRDLQTRGEPTRRGIFLTPAALVQAGESDTTVIPRERFRGLVGADVKYFHRDAEKSFRLPKALMNATVDEMHAAIARWAGQH